MEAEVEKHAGNELQIFSPPVTLAAQTYSSHGDRADREL